MLRGAGAVPDLIKMSVGIEFVGDLEGIKVLKQVLVLMNDGMTPSGVTSDRGAGAAGCWRA